MDWVTINGCVVLQSLVASVTTKSKVPTVVELELVVVEIGMEGCGTLVPLGNTHVTEVLAVVELPTAVMLGVKQSKLNPVTLAFDTLISECGEVVFCKMENTFEVTQKLFPSCTITVHCPGVVVIRLGLLLNVMLVPVKPGGKKV